MRLTDFFDAMGTVLRGQAPPTSLRTLGPTPSSDADLAFYPWLLASDQARILAELMPTVRRWVELSGLDWNALVAAYVRDRPPAGHSVPWVGARFADWLSTAPFDGLPAGIDALADFTWTAFLCRTAVDHGPDLDRRVFVRHYTHDPRPANAALKNDSLPGPSTPATLVVYRDEATGKARVQAADVPSLAALLDHAGIPRSGALALEGDALAAARSNLIERGILPQRAPQGAGDEA